LDSSGGARQPSRLLVMNSQLTRQEGDKVDEFSAEEEGDKNKTNDYLSSSSVHSLCLLAIVPPSVCYFGCGNKSTKGLAETQKEEMDGKRRQ
jgi:hypothetical protein